MSGWRKKLRAIIMAALASAVALAAAGCATAPYDGGGVRGPDGDDSRGGYSGYM